VVEHLRQQGHTSLRALARELNAGGFSTARGGAWHPTTVANLLSRRSAVGLVEAPQKARGIGGS